MAYPIATVDVSYGIDVKTMTFDSNDGTTLASWVDQTLAALTPCLPPE